MKISLITVILIFSTFKIYAQVHGLEHMIKSDDWGGISDLFMETFSESPKVLFHQNPEIFKRWMNCKGVEFIAYLNSKDIVPLEFEFSSGLSPFILACQCGRTDVVASFISRQNRVININKANKDGTTAIMFAASKNSLEVVKLLLEQGANPRLTDRNGENALYYAVSEENIDSADINLVKLFISEGVQVYNKEAKSWSPIFYSLLGDRLELFKLLYNVHLAKGQTELFKTEGFDAILPLILKLEYFESLYPFSTIKNNSTDFWEDAIFELCDVLPLGIEYKADSVKTPYYSYIRMKLKDLKEIIDLYPIFDISNFNSNIEHHWQCILDSPLLLDFLLENGFDVNRTLEGKTIVDFLISNILSRRTLTIQNTDYPLTENENAEVNFEINTLKKIIGVGAILQNEKIPIVNFVLHQALKEKKYILVYKLLNKFQINLKLKDKHGKNAFYYAKKTKEKKYMKLIRRKNTLK